MSGLYGTSLADLARHSPEAQAALKASVNPSATVAHAGLFVTDLDRSQRWYEALGFTFDRAGRAGQLQLHPADASTEFGVPASAVGGGYLAVAVPIDDFDARTEAALNVGGQYLGVPHNVGDRRTIEMLDPDGHTVVVSALTGGPR